MADIIQLLPDSVANQIAAGEVVQRPASVVKELTENAIDAGSLRITINIKDAGKTLIQIIDNGCGMSATDARLSFERHATSKIRTADDLYHIKTMGFRGEALASIAAIAQVELKTRLHDSDLGTCLMMSASEVISQEACSCAPGSNFSVKNLFFNVPARRKFLKSNSAELSHILDEIQRLALAHPEVAMVLIHNDVELVNVPASNIKIRIVNLLGKSLNQNLIPVSNQTSLADIKGYIGTPQIARKNPGEQFFFVNNRYMRHPYFYRAVVKAYENILPPDAIPAFFIYFTVDPAEIDVNIHPTKTEIKFENELHLWQILHATIKEGLGKHNVVPTLDFNTESAIDLSPAPFPSAVRMPEIKIDPSFNPFGTNYRQPSKIPDFPLGSGRYSTPGYPPEHTESGTQTILPATHAGQETRIFYQYKNKYILTAVKSGLMMIDQKRAHERIVYEEIVHRMQEHSIITQKCLYPLKVELNSGDAQVLNSNLDSINQLGFDISFLGNGTFVINGTPPEVEQNLNEVLDEILALIKNTNHVSMVDYHEKIVISLAKAAAIGYGKNLNIDEMQNLFDRLFACASPNYTPDGKLIITIIDNEEFEKRFK